MCSKIFKIVLCGKQRVGKTSIFLRLSHGNDLVWEEARAQRIDQCKITVQAENQSGEIQPIEFILWDTADMEVHQSLSRPHYHGSAIILLVYSVDDMDSLDQLEYYYKECERHAPGAPRLLIRNKIDLTEESSDFCVPLDEEKKLSKEKFKFAYKKSIKTSAATGQGMDTLKKAIGKILLKHSLPQQNETSNPFDNVIVPGSHNPGRSSDSRARSSLLSKCC